MKNIFRSGLLILSLIVSAIASAENGSRPIQDNSFLIEEAYNQEAGIVQHISTWRWNEGGEWNYTFTQEWPLFSQRHQISFTIPVLKTKSDLVSFTGLGDIAINYRYQLVGNSETQIAIAPRFSVILPTGSERKHLGEGRTAVQLNFPVSVYLLSKLVTHFNSGFTYTPERSHSGRKEPDTLSVNVGQSLIYELRPNFNLMLEAAWENKEVISDSGTSGRDYSFFLNPGVRWAYNTSSGLQIVPGISMPIGLGQTRGDVGILVYLSFEHPF